MLKTAAMHTKLGGLRNRGHHHTGCILNSIGSNAGNTLHTRAEGEGLWVFQSSTITCVLALYRNPGWIGMDSPGLVMTPGVGGLSSNGSQQILSQTVLG